MTGRGKKTSKNISLSRNKRSKASTKETLEEQTDYSEESQTESRSETSKNAKLYTGIKRKCPSSERCTLFQEEAHFSGASDQPESPESMPNQSQLGEFEFDAEGDEIGVSQAKGKTRQSRRIHKAIDDKAADDLGVKNTNIDNSNSREQDRHCPVCSTTFTPSKKIEFINEHVDHCLNDEPQDLTGNCVKDKKTVCEPQSLLEAKEQTHEVTECRDNPQLNDELVVCQICQKDLSHMNSQRRLQHMNRCCDKVEQKQKSTRSLAHPQTSQLTCLICGKPCKSSQAQQRHLKKCAQQHGVSTSQVLELVHNQEQQRPLPLVVSHTGTSQPSDSRGVSKKRGRMLKTSIRNIDEDTQLAMALSASIVPPSDAPVKRKGRGRRKKDQGDELPALLLRSREETRQVVAVRAAQVICPQEDEGEDDEDLITSTPALAPSKLAQNTQIENNNSEANKKESAGDVMEVIVECQGEDSDNNTVNDFLKTNVAASADVASCTTAEQNNLIDIAQSKCSNESEQSRIAVCAALSQSFVSFLQEDEVAKDMTSKPPKPKISDGFTSLWSLAALEDNPNSQDFYVPRLLPEKSTKNSSKDSTREMSSVGQTHASQSTKAQQKDAVISESTLNTTPHEPSNAGGHVSEDMTPSQEVDVLILADLAEGVYGRDVSIASQRVGSCDDGEFAASGFCLPVEDAWKDMQQNVSSEGVQQLLRDLTAMIGNSSLSDVTLVTKGNYQIPAHSFMLSFRSKTLAEMLKSQTAPELHQNHSEETSGANRLLSFQETEPVVMEAVLKFIYTGLVQVPVSWIDDVEKLSQRLQLCDLSKACEKLKEKLPSHETEGAVVDEGCFLDVQNLVRGMMEETEPGEGSDTEMKDSEYWEGFDDEDIEEVRMFQTQSIKSRAGENDEDGLIYEKGNVLSESGLLECEGGLQTDVKANASPIQNSDGEGVNVATHKFEEIEDITEVNKIWHGYCPDLQQEIRKGGESPAQQSLKPSPGKSIPPLGEEEEKPESGLPYEEFEATNACDPPVECWGDRDLGEDYLSSEETGIQETAFMESESNFESSAEGEFYEDVPTDRADVMISLPVGFPSEEADESIELLSDDGCDVQISPQAETVTCVPETSYSPRKTTLFASKRKDSSRPRSQKNPRSDSTQNSDSCKGSGESSSGEDSSCSQRHDLNSEATKFLTNLRGRVSQASKTKGFNRKKAKRTSPKVKNPPATQASTNYGTKSLSHRSSDCQASMKRPSSGVKSPDRCPKVFMTGTLVEVDLTPSHFSKTAHVSSPRDVLQSSDYESVLQSPSSPSAQSPRTPSTPCRSSTNSPQFSPTMFPSPRSSPTIVRSPIVKSKNQEREEKGLRKDLLLDISRGDLNESVNLEDEAHFDVDDLGSPFSPVVMSPPVPSPRYSFLDTHSYLDPSPSNATQNRTAPSWDILVSNPVPPDELCCSPVEPVGNQFESPAESRSVMRDEDVCIELEISAEASSPGIGRSSKGGHKKQCARNLQNTEEFCVKNADKTKHKKRAINLELGLRERLEAKQLGLTDNNCPQTVRYCSSDEDQNSMSQNNSREYVRKENAQASDSVQFHFHDDGGFNCDLDDNVAEVPKKDERITTTTREELQSSIGLKSVLNAEAGVAVISSRRKRDRIADDRKTKNGQANRARKKPRSQQICSDSDNEQSQQERRGTKSKLGKESQKSGKGKGKGAKTVLTPMPDYDDMVTPDLKKELHKFGVRALPKRKMVAKLTEIYQYTHRPSSEDESNESEVGTVQHSREQVPIPSATQTCPATVRKEIETARTGESGEMCNSDCSYSSGEEEFGDCTMEIADDDVTPSQQVTFGNLNERLLRYIQDNKELYLKILQYKPMELLSFHEQIKSDGISCPLNKLVDFLDQQCITFTTASVRQRPRQRRKVGKKNKDKRVNKS